MKQNNRWGTVCDDAFEEIDAQAACLTLGFKGLTSFKTHNSEYSDSVYPTLMDDVACATNTSDFLQCSTAKEDCSHTEDILLSCH